MKEFGPGGGRPGAPMDPPMTVYIKQSKIQSYRVTNLKIFAEMFREIRTLCETNDWNLNRLKSLTENFASRSKFI